MSDMRRFRFSLSLPYDCPHDEEVMLAIIKAAAWLLERHETKTTSISTARVGGWVTTDRSQATDSGLTGTVFLAHAEVEGREFDLRFVFVDVTAEEPLPTSATERFTVRHPTSGLLN